MKRFQGPLLLSCVLAGMWACQVTHGHDRSRTRFLRTVAFAQAKANALAEPVSSAAEETCQLRIVLVDSWTKDRVGGLVRITNLDSGKQVTLSDEFHRAMNWFALAEQSTVVVPRARLRIEALRGLNTLVAVSTVDLNDKAFATVQLTLKQFYETRLRDVRSGNTHLHLMNLTHAEADRYLRVVPKADDLDLVFLSLLRRVPDERNYISNQIVENSLAGGDLQRLSQDGVLFGNGQEHRHNFGGYGEGYGHVMLLNLQRLIRPVSIGPGIMQQGTDGRPLQSGIRSARDDGATVIWCHNTFGTEDIPNWASGLIHAQNIFDGGDHGTYADTFYRYLNIGMRVPFSTGTDWFIYDFSRVYTPVDGDLTAEKWLESLRAGKSYITNGPFLELETERAGLGGTLQMTGPNRVTVVGRGMGRLDFKGLELVYNGKIVHRVKAKRVEGYYSADLRHSLEVDEPGWFALRIPPKSGKTELDRPLFAHTSPIYIEVAGNKIFRVDVAKQLIEEMQAGSRTVEEKGTFANEAERRAVLDVYRNGIEALRQRMTAATQE